MQLRNAFSEKTRKLFLYEYHCHWCGRNSWDALHHIVGRSSNSPYNASPIHNLACHIGNSKLQSFDAISELLKKTKRFLDSEGYSPTPEDKEFMKKNKRYYV